MAFITEKISAADKNKIDMERILSIGSYFIEPSIWVADRKNDIYLFSLGGGSNEMPSFFGIWIKKNIIFFEADRSGKGNNQTGITLEYNILKITIPDILATKKEKIRQLIIEALNAYGQYGDRIHVTSVAVKFNNVME